MRHIINNAIFGDDKMCICTSKTFLDNLWTFFNEGSQDFSCSQTDRGKLVVNMIQNSSSMIPLCTWEAPTARTFQISVNASVLAKEGLPHLAFSYFDFILVCTFYTIRVKREIIVLCKKGANHSTFLYAKCILIKYRNITHASKQLVLVLI